MLGSPFTQRIASTYGVRLSSEMECPTLELAEMLKEDCHEGCNVFRGLLRCTLKRV